MIDWIIGHTIEGTLQSPHLAGRQADATWCKALALFWLGLSSVARSYPEPPFCMNSDGTHGAPEQQRCYEFGGNSKGFRSSLPGTRDSRTKQYHLTTATVAQSPDEQFTKFGQKSSYFTVPRSRI